MNRRSFIGALCLLSLANKKFVFRIKTKSGGIIGNIVIHAKNMDAAKHKLRERYPNCEVLDAEER